MFEVTPDDIALLRDDDLRSLVARLCEAEMRKRGFPTSFVTWGGDQDAPDGGLDIRVSLPATAQIEGWVPRLTTGFQVRKPKMPRARILAEMRPAGSVRQVIRELADQSGAYIIVSSGDSTTDAPLRHRRAAMMEAVTDLPNAGCLTLDFYDRRRLATWVGDHPGAALWVREKIGRPLTGWRPYGAWADISESMNGEYLHDDKLRLHTPAAQSPDGCTVRAGLDQLRNVLRQPGRMARLVGLSGVGKTRLLQALFENGAGDQNLDPLLAFYTNVPDSPDPQPTDLASQLIARQDRAIIVVDNCPSELHQRLSQVCRSEGSTVSAITVEYDIRDDLPEGTEVFRLDTSSLELIENLIERRYGGVSATDRQTIARFSDGNARIAIALAGTLGRNESIGGVRDEELVQRLVEQRHGHDAALLDAAQACSLVYSFNGEDVGAESELNSLGALVGQVALDFHRRAADLLDRGVVQKRSVWRAVLPPAIANRLATVALRRIPLPAIERHVIKAAPERLLRSFSRRLGYLHASPGAVDIVKRWLSEGGILHSVTELDELHRAMFENVAPAAPEEALKALEDGLVGTNDSKMLWNCRTYVNVLRSLAYDAGLFSRCVALLARIAIACDVNENSNRALDALASLFQICYSGTHTPIDRRLEWIRTLLDCHSTESNKLVLKALEATLEAWQFRPFHDFEFGARSRDYGYWPRSEEEVRHWFGLALKLSKELACSNEPIAAGVRQILTEQLRGLWNRAGTYDEIEETFCAISQAQFWPGGWLAIRQVRHFDGKGLRPDISARLSSLEAALKPTNIAQNVRSIVLSEDIAGSYITDTDDENLTAAMARTAGIAYELGKSVAGDDGLVGELLPELVRTQGERVWRFGQGLARASSDPRTLWDRLVGAFAATAKGHERFQVLCGFMEELHAVAPAITDELLDSALQDKRVASVFPALQGAAGIDKRGLERLRSGLRSGLIPVGNFRLLIAGGACDAIPENELTSMILQIASAPGGFEAAAEILHMRLHRDVNTNRMPSDEMMSLGRELLRQTTFTRDHDIRRDYCLGQLCRTCLGGDEGAAVARGICRRLKAAVSGYTAYVFENDDLIAGLFTKHPTLALDELCGGNSNELDKGVHMLHSLRQNPLDSIPENELFVWCDNEPATRYPAVASAMTAYTGKHVNEPKHWTARALHLLERAADRVDICRRYVAQIEITWHTPMLEQLVKLLDEVHIPSDAALVNFVAKEKARLRDLVEARRLAEGTACRVQNERFE